MTTPQAYIVDAVRTPVGKRGGSLAKAHPADLGAHVISAIVDRTGIDPEVVDDVVFGCVDAIVFGHTHRPHCEVRSGVLLFNPGPIAPTYYTTPGPQIGLLHVSAQGMTTEIIRL